MMTKLSSLIHVFLKWIKKILSIINIWQGVCPECGGILQAYMLDMIIDKMVWKCDKCGKEYI
jgi:uncharacterized protein with PIN domain